VGWKGVEDEDHQQKFPEASGALRYPSMFAKNHAHV
jgi:hypothetical protein